MLMLQMTLFKLLLVKFKVLADKKKHVYDDDIAALVDDSYN